MGSDRQQGNQWYNRLQTRLYLGSAVIMLVGLGAAAVVYLAAGDVPEGVPDFDIEGSRRSLRDLELYGGKANVLVAEFMEWFSGLWHGRSLAYTIACITVVISCGLFYVAHNWPSDN
ncbi:MAG: hypothetical protein ABSA86_05030 [Oryzomonas sp.]|jgi:hypothetical protein